MAPKRCHFGTHKGSKSDQNWSTKSSQKNEAKKKSDSPPGQPQGDSKEAPGRLSARSEAPVAQS